MFLLKKSIIHIYFHYFRWKVRILTVKIQSIFNLSNWLENILLWTIYEWRTQTLFTLECYWRKMNFLPLSLNNPIVYQQNPKTNELRNHKTVDVDATKRKRRRNFTGRNSECYETKDSNWGIPSVFFAPNADNFSSWLSKEFCRW